MRAPFAPPRLSEPRKVDADAHAVDTSSRDGQARSQDLGLERCDVLLHRSACDSTAGIGILPDEFFGWNLRAEVTRARAHVAVRELEPRTGEGIGELVRVLQEAPGPF